MQIQVREFEVTLTLLETLNMNFTVIPKIWSSILEYGIFRRVISGTFIPEFES